jgi:lipoyl(octanoyl) transferase
VDNHKVAAVGIKCRKWITQHGVAIHVEESSLEGFSNIVPCGLEGCHVGYINQFLDESSKLTVREFAPNMESALEEVFCMRAKLERLLARWLIARERDSSIEKKAKEG